MASQAPTAVVEHENGMRVEGRIRASPRRRATIRFKASGLCGGLVATPVFVPFFASQQFTGVIDDQGC